MEQKIKKLDIDFFFGPKKREKPKIAYELIRNTLFQKGNRKKKETIHIWRLSSSAIPNSFIYFVK